MTSLFTVSSCLGIMTDVTVPCLNGYVAPCAQMYNNRVLGKPLCYQYTFLVWLMYPFLLFFGTFILSVMLMFNFAKALVWILTLGYLSPWRETTDCYCKVFFHRNHVPPELPLTKQRLKSRKESRYIFSVLPKSEKLDMSYMEAETLVDLARNDPQPFYKALMFLCCIPIYQIT